MNTKLRNNALLEKHGKKFLSIPRNLRPIHKLIKSRSALLLLALIFSAFFQQAESVSAQPLGNFLTKSGAPAPVFFNSANDAGQLQEMSGKTTSEGLKVHGHWVIDVKNPDGKIVEHREFENALSFSAQGYLIGLLGGYITPGDLMIAMSPQSGNGACNATYQFCGITRSLSTYPALSYCGVYYCSTGLTYASNFGTNFAGPYSFVLSGSITANQTGTLGSVYTIFSGCANSSPPTNPTAIQTTSPATCASNTSANWVGPLTSTNFTPVTVVNGQIVQVTVTITFS